MQKFLFLRTKNPYVKNYLHFRAQITPQPPEYLPPTPKCRAGPGEPDFTAPYPLTPPTEAENRQKPKIEKSHFLRIF